MIGRKIVAAAFLLPVLTVAVSSDITKFLTYVSAVKSKGYFQNDKLDLPVADICGPKFVGFEMAEPLCAKFTELADEMHSMESTHFCTNIECGATYDPSTGLCLCGWGTESMMKEALMWPNKNCEDIVQCFAPFAAHWNPLASLCICSVQTFPQHASSMVSFKPSSLRDVLYANDGTDVNVDTQVEPFLSLALTVVEKELQHNEHSIEKLRDSFMTAFWQRAKVGRLVPLSTMKDMFEEYIKLAKMRAALVKGKAQLVDINRIEPRTLPEVVSLAPLPTYIPPPNAQVTKELIEESLLIQPQQVATVHSVIPHFADGVITFLVQLDGPISQTLALNATDTLPCAIIGSQPPRNLILVPKMIKNGISETVLPDCLIIAINMYDPNYITYWVQNESGSVFSLLSDNKIHAIDQLDLSQPASLAIRVAPSDKKYKRAIGFDASASAVQRRQVFSITCGHPCPFHHMQPLKGGDGYCGCMFKSASESISLTARGVEAPSQYTASMTAEACAAMTCLNNGGKPALFNPFTASCWCTSPTFVEENNSAYGSRM